MLSFLLLGTLVFCYAQNYHYNGQPKKRYRARHVAIKAPFKEVYRILHPLPWK